MLRPIARHRLCVLPILFALGCQQPTESKKANDLQSVDQRVAQPNTQDLEEKSHPGDSPEEAFKVFQDAVANDNWKDVVKLSASESTNKLTTLYALMLARMKKTNEGDDKVTKPIESLLVSNGVALNLDDVAKLKSREEIDVFCNQFAKTVKDIPKFIADASEFYSNVLGKQGTVAYYPLTFGDPQFTIVGDVATSKMAATKHNIHMVRLGGEWKVDLSDLYEARINLFK